MTPASRLRLTDILPWLTSLGVLAQLLSLRLGLFNRFFFDSMHADVQGIDFFCLPKAFLNLLAHRSAYDTFGPPTYGPHFTWYLAHPALAVVLGSWLSLFPPMESYGIYTLLSLVLMAACAAILAQQSTDPLHRRLIWFLLLTAAPTYWMLFVGNVQALLVLALGMLYAGMLRLTYNAERSTSAQPLIFAGLLLSLLTKPAVLLMLPLLLLLRETRRAAARATVLYLALSAAFEFIPSLNPESIGLRQVAWLAVHPSTVVATMNIYTNHLQVTPWMKDNSIHWLNLVAQSGTRMAHVDVFSLPVFLDSLTGVHTPAWIYPLFLLALFALQILVARIPDRPARLEAALLLLFASTLAFFLAYSTVWEYQYTSILPVAATLLLLRHRNVSYLPATTPMFLLATCAWLPSLYFLTEGHPLTSATLTLIRLDRILPATLLFLLTTVIAARIASQHLRAPAA